MKQKNKKEDFLASHQLHQVLVYQEIYQQVKESKEQDIVLREKEGVIIVSYEIGFLLLPHRLTNFEMQKYCQNEPRLNGIYSRDNLPNKIKYGAYVINLDEYSDLVTH